MDQLVLDRVQVLEGWTLSPADHPVIAAKHRPSRPSFAVLLLFYRVHGRFPRHGSEIDSDAIAAVASQIDAPVKPCDVLNTGDRTVKRHRAETRNLHGFREATVADGEALGDWLRDHAVSDSRDIGQLTEVLEGRCRSL